MNKNTENREILENLTFSASIRDIIHFKNSIYLFTKTTGQEPLSLLTLFNIPIHEFCRKLEKIGMKTLKVEKF